MNPAPSQKSGTGKFVIQISKGIIRDPLMRRRAMFFVITSALLMLFAGVTFLAPSLDKRPFLFIAYWGACGWLTILSILMAIYDLLIMRAKMIQKKRQFIAEILRNSKNDG